MIKVYQNKSVISDNILDNSIIIVNQNELNKYKLLYIDKDININTLDGYINKLLSKNSYYSLASKEISLIFLRNAFINVKDKLLEYNKIDNYDFYNILYKTYFFYKENEIINNSKTHDLKIIYDEFERLLNKNYFINKYDMYKLILDNVNNIEYENIIFENIKSFDINTMLFINKLKNNKNIVLYANTINNESFINELNKFCELSTNININSDVYNLFSASSGNLFKNANIVSCNDLYEEVMYVYNDIIDNINNGLKFSDILIVSTDINRYISYFKQIFKVSISISDTNNVIVKFFNILSKILNGDFSAYNFIDLLKLNLINEKKDLIDKMDNYLYKNMLFDDNFYEIDFENNNLNELKLSVINPIKYLLENVINEKSTNEILKYLFMYLDEEGITDKLNLYDSKSYNKLIEILEYLNDYLDEIDISEILKFIMLLLSSNNISIEELDKINVCKLDDYYDNNYKKVYFMGFTLDDIPGTYKYNTLINNNDLKKETVFNLIEKHYDSIYNNISNVLLNNNVVITYHKLDDTPSKKEKSSLLDKFYNKPIQYSCELFKEDKKNFNLKIDSSLARKLYGDTLELSPSSLEVYSKCKYSYFLKYGLKLDIKEKKEFDVRMIGTYVHYLLYKSLKTNSDDFELFTNLFISENKIKITNTISYVLDELKKNTKIVLSLVKKELESSKFLPYKLEDKIDDLNFEIGFKNGKVKFKGIVDRIDKYEDSNGFYYRIIDYKTGAKKFRIDDVLIGLNMQMLIYLLALKNINKDKKIIPTGFLYQPAFIKYNQELINEKDDIVYENIKKENKLNGIISNNHLDLYDEDSFNYIDVKTRNNFNEEKVLTDKELDILFKGVVDVIKKEAEQLLDGDIKINPINDSKNESCKYCEFNSICNFDLKKDSARRYKKLSKKEVLDKLEGDLNGNLDN